MKVIEENTTIIENFDLDLIDLSPIGIAYLNADGKVLHANPMLLQMMEVSEGNGDYKAKLRIQELSKLKVVNDNRSILDCLQAGETIQSKEIEYTLTPLVKKWMNISGVPSLGLNGKIKGAVLMCSDITEYKEMQDQLQQAQKMEVLGQLACGVAHDFNNLLTVIIGNTELALINLEPDNPLQKYIEEVRKAADRATSLTNRLLAFSRKQPIELSVFSLNKIIREMDQMLPRLLRENIELVTVSEPNLWKIKANPGQIEQVIINLTVNSCDAMIYGGKLIIETENTELSQDYAGGKPEVNPGKYVMLTVTDTGCGMTKEVMAKVFDPFFTTKESGKGTGLGLSTVYSIVKQVGGYVWVYSEPGQGTTFKIYLPVAEEENYSFSHPIIRNKNLSGNETILIVEDENDVRETVAKMFMRFGYNVVAVGTGDEAIAFCRQNKEQVQLLLTDLVLPDTNGLEVADELREMCPGIKVLVTSGYSANTINHQRAQRLDYPYIQKPFSLATLVATARKVLDSELVAAES